MGLGVKESKVAKTKFHIKSVIDKCNDILTHTARANKMTEQVQNDVNFLTAWGMPTPGSVPLSGVPIGNAPLEKKADEPVTETVSAAQETTQRDPNWFDARNRKK